MKESKIERIYFRHEHLANYYASKIFNEGNISLERKDIEQELKMKLWTSIKSYLKNWKEYKETGRMKPVPIKFYLKTAMINRAKDFIKEINRVQTVSMSAINFDHGVDSCPVEIDFKSKRINVGFVDILEDLDKEEKNFFMLYLKGFSPSKINKIHKGKKDPRICLKQNLEKFKKNLPSLVLDVKEYKVIHNNNED